jgi:hypothetical protein
MAHRLDPLLKPASIAVLGATERPGTVGRIVVENLVRGGFAGTAVCREPGAHGRLRRAVLPVAGCAAHVRRARHLRRRRYARRSGARRNHRAWRQGRDDHVVARARERRVPALRERVAARIREHGLLVCGANGMGYYNFREGIWACGFQTRAHRRGGNVAFISHSGSGMCGIVDTDERLDFNLVVSTGQELAVAMDDYVDFALDLPSTRVVGLFMETVRNPAGLRRALEKGERPWHPGGRNQGRPYRARRAADRLAHRGDCRRGCELRGAVRSLRRPSCRRSRAVLDGADHVCAAACRRQRRARLDPRFRR